jgi:hypothetical protein
LGSAPPDKIVPATLHKATVVIGGIPIDLETGNAAFMPVLESRYRGFLNGQAGPRRVDTKLEGVRLELETVEGLQGDPDAELVVRREGKIWHLQLCDLRAEWDRATGRGKVWQTVNPYSMDTVLRILHSLLLAEQRGFLLHAASVVVGKRAFVCSGESGAGKTTISRLAPATATVLTDEISYLKMEEGEFRAWGTPFNREMERPGPNLSSPLAGVFLLGKGPENRVEEMRPDEAVCSILRNVLFFADDPDLAGRVLETVCQLVEKVPVRRLIFRPDARVWDYVASLAAVA